MHCRQLTSALARAIGIFNVTQDFKAAVITETYIHHYNL